MATPWVTNFIRQASEVIPGFRTDANDSTIFTERMLEQVEQKFYEVDLRELTHTKYVPVATGDMPGMQQITYYMAHKVGKSKIVARNGADLPRVDVFTSRHTQPVRIAGNSFAFSQADLRSAQSAQVPLDMLKVETARRANNELQSNVAYLGDASHGLIGFLTHPNITLVQVALNAATTSRLWANKTGEEVAKDINKAVSNVRTKTFQKRQPTTLLISLAQYEYIRRAILTTTLPYPMTIYEWLMKQDAFGLTEIFGIPELTGAGPGGTDAFIVYEKSPDVVQQRIPMQQTMHPPQFKGLEIITPTEMELGGTVVRYPLACEIHYGI